ncbi:hypothetical protein JIG36_29775 [Actinoplanes sp. LDG1-06]|uniref:Uncharacterized protein n=1 Tax=Paractinoplanes ovalisporus TaxID=2810368 RepID=A0ABS2AIR6_9ACTN|nr:hypothetical protein [Actinoplanes ovalisporus]MBM2619705.1 hypothetical protein [Actinoplanes ovalisporus]
MRFALAAATATAAVFGFAAPAAAADYDRSAEDCTVVRHDVGVLKQTVYVRNVCSQPITFRVHRSLETSPCLEVQPGRQGGWRWTRAQPYYYTEIDC